MLWKGRRRSSNIEDRRGMGMALPVGGGLGGLVLVLLLSALFGGNPTAEIVNAASPITYANAEYPPTLFVHGTADDRVPHAMTMRMYQALEQAGVPVDLHLYAGQDHFFDQEPQFSAAVAEAMAFFMARYVPARAAVMTA